MARGAERAYTAHPKRCHACAERERAADEHARQGGSDMRGLYFSTSRD